MDKSMSGNAWKNIKIISREFGFENKDRVSAEDRLFRWRL
jgi:hypothetical protein